ncbi:hypothetical protein K431DRAFT_127225 [Polychaeton citri CBS 116435]|uniref:Uncharacterized protein n=1 Tax=Polychaeton citri CBS 116435 TaxID=1314669 RepID=A0A9P4Q5G2_9PEZI|nr:hypothetical protein K431DRAFT_127225 [Polychaeton citri CBS 116435]
MAAPLLRSMPEGLTWTCCLGCLRQARWLPSVLAARVYPRSFYPRRLLLCCRRVARSSASSSHLSMPLKPSRQIQPALTLPAYGTHSFHFAMDKARIPRHASGVMRAISAIVDNATSTTSSRISPTQSYLPITASLATLSLSLSLSLIWIILGTGSDPRRTRLSIGLPSEHASHRVDRPYCAAAL